MYFVLTFIHLICPLHLGTLFISISSRISRTKTDVRGVCEYNILQSMEDSFSNRQQSFCSVELCHSPFIHYQNPITMHQLEYYEHGGGGWGESWDSEKIHKGFWSVLCLWVRGRISSWGGAGGWEVAGGGQKMINDLTTNIQSNFRCRVSLQYRTYHFSSQTPWKS